MTRKCKIEDKEIIVEKEDCIGLNPTVLSRENWDEAFREMHLNNDDELLIDDIFYDEFPHG